MKKVINSYLHRHEVYITRRIEIIHCALNNRTDREDLVREILYYLIGEKTTYTEFPQEAKGVIDELKHLVKSWDIILDGDILGYLYQGLTLNTVKKTNGQYFTPSTIVDHIVSNLITPNINFREIKILDPACGSGQFLLSVYHSLLSIYIANGYNQNVASELILNNNIYGCDIDPIAVEITKYNLQNAYGKDVNVSNITREDFIGSTNMTSDRRILECGFDIILGNPPWGSNFSKQQKAFFKNKYLSAETGLNSFTLFIEKSISILAEQGKLLFLTPEAYLNIKAHKNSRVLVLDNCKIIELTTWGEQFQNVFAPSISMLIQKNSSHKARNENIIQIRDVRSIESGTARLIPQQSYYSNYQNIFNIHFSQKSETIISKIQERGSIHLKDNARFFLGIVTGSNNNFLSEEFSDHYPDRILIGKDIKKYKVSFSGTYFKYDPVKLQQVAPQPYYMAKRKILYKFIGKNLTFAVDDKGYYTLNNVNGFIPTFPDCDSEYLVALLNSPIIQYFYEKSFFTIKVLKGNLEKLPLKILPQTEMKRISALSQQASLSSSNTEFEKYTDQINDIFFNAYGISDREAARIMYRATKEDIGQNFLFHH